MNDMTPVKLTIKDWESDQEVRWCPGCGDYAILKAVQRTMVELGSDPAQTVFVSGIGCSSRFPYYMASYGFHTIHGRAPAVATGIKLANPELDIWLVTGDGDGMSIGGNHTFHFIRRNINSQIMLFNNEIYGLTKGQYSPTSAKGTVAKSTPDGSVDNPFSPLKLAIGAGGTFLARTFDKDMKHMEKTVKAAHLHKGTSLVEVLQNCVIFNDEVFEPTVGKENRGNTMIFVEHGQKLIFGKDNEKGLKLNHGSFEIVSAVDNPDQVAVYNENDPHFLQTFEAVGGKNGIPVPFGVLYREQRSIYEEDVEAQVQAVVAKKGRGDLRKLLHAGETWVVS